MLKLYTELECWTLDAVKHEKSRGHDDQLSYTHTAHSLIRLRSPGGKAHHEEQLAEFAILLYDSIRTVTGKRQTLTATLRAKHMIGDLDKA